MNMRKYGSVSVPACEILPRRKRGRSRYIACAMICLVVTSSAFGQPAIDFAKANEEFAQGHFKEAMQICFTIWEMPISEPAILAARF
jgi:hypothetical protein